MTYWTFCLPDWTEVVTIYPPDWNESIGFAENSDDAFDVAKNWMESAYDGGDAEAQGMTWEQVLKQ